MNFNDEQLQQLLGFALPEENQPQGVPQIQQGLLGSTGAQNQNLQDVISGGQNAAAQLGQTAQAASQNFAPIDRADTAQMATQNNAQKSQQQAQAGALLGKIASMFIPGGSILGFIKSKL